MHKIAHVSWEILYFLHTVNLHGTQNIKIGFKSECFIDHQILKVVI